MAEGKNTGTEGRTVDGVSFVVSERGEEYYEYTHGSGITAEIELRAAREIIGTRVSRADDVVWSLRAWDAQDVTLFVSEGDFFATREKAEKALARIVCAGAPTLAHDTDTEPEIDHITRDGVTVTVTRVEPDGYTVDADDDADRWGAVRKIGGVWSWTLYEGRDDGVGGRYAHELVGERAHSARDAVRALAHMWTHYAQPAA